MKNSTWLAIFFALLVLGLMVLQYLGASPPAEVGHIHTGGCCPGH